MATRQSEASSSSRRPQSPLTAGDYYSFYPRQPPYNPLYLPPFHHHNHNLGHIPLPLPHPQGQDYLIPTTTHGFESYHHHPSPTNPVILAAAVWSRRNSDDHDSDSCPHSISPQDINPSGTNSVEDSLERTQPSSAAVAVPTTSTCTSRLWRPDSPSTFIELQRPESSRVLGNRDAVIKQHNSGYRMESEMEACGPRVDDNDVDVASSTPPDEEENSGDGDGSSTGGKPLSERNGKHHKCASLAGADPKLCGVCGDKALGNNFNAITCESCKAFFRRNALRPKEFICPFNDNCKVDPVTRRFCQKCRLKKCFDIGMKKEWIMTDEEKKMKKQKIELNRLKRASSSDVREGDPTNPKERAVSGAAAASAAVAVNGGGGDPDLDHLFPLHGSSPDASNSNSSSEGPNFGQLVPQSVMMPHNNNNNNNSSNSQFPVLNQNGGGGVAIAASGNNTIPTTIPNNNKGVGIGTIDQIVAAASVLQDQQQQQQQQQYHNQQNNYNGGGGENNVGSFVDESNPSAQPPPQHPILASLVRPGLPDSPPEVLAVHTHSHDCPDYPTKKKTLLQQYNMEMTTHHGHTDHLCPEDADSPPQHLVHVPHHTHYLDHIHSSSSSSKGEDMPPLPLNTMESILSVAISAEFNAFGFNDEHHNDEHPHHHHHNHNNNHPSASPVGSSSSSSHHSCGSGSRGGGISPNSRSLNKAEKGKLSELFFASEALNAPVDLDGPIKIATSDPSLINVINLTDIAIRRLIKMSKKMYAFKNMCQEDQIALLKGGCTEMMILRSVVSYDPERDSWNIPHSNGFNVKLGVLKEARGNLYEQHQRFVKSFKGEWRQDYNIMIILCAITLFTPERPNVIHKDVVKLEQDSYYYLLKRYLESTRNGCEARSTYLQLIQRIAELHILNSNHLRVFLEVNPREVEPLLIEIFDLKQ